MQFQEIRVHSSTSAELKCKHILEEQVGIALINLFFCSYELKERQRNIVVIKMLQTAKQDLVLRRHEG